MHHLRPVLIVAALVSGLARAQDTSATAQPPTPAPTADAQAAPAPSAAPSPTAIQVTGFIDWYYEHNFNRPPRYVSDGEGGSAPAPVQNVLRNFDFKDDQFSLNMAEVVIQKAPAPVGFHVNLAFGKATDWIHAAEPGGADTYKHILQAYLTAPAKVLGKADTIDVGKFVTSHGYEVIETKDNWNYTRGLLFAWAIPYYHAGLRYNHPIDATSSLSLHLVNGWNDVEDNNSSPSFGFMYSKALTPKLTWVQNYMGGPEQPHDNHDIRHLIDTSLTYAASSATTLALNTDFGFDRVDGKRVRWSGIAGYVHQALSPSTALTARAEYFDDKDGFATGTAQKVHEATLTYEWKAAGGLVTRAEARYDRSNQDVFLGHDGSKRSQMTVLLGTVYAFG